MGTSTDFAHDQLTRLPHAPVEEDVRVIVLGWFD